MIEEYKTLSDLPNDPFEMPPPYWRSSGTIFQITDALENLCIYLKKLLEILPNTQALLDNYLDRNPNFEEDDEEFMDISEPLYEIESKIKLKCELSVFMAAIEIEDLLNMISVFNLKKDVSESIEKLSPMEKLLIISATLTDSPVKDSKPYDALKKLISWRNAYAHGHCTDRPVKSLRHNHLISPESYPTVPKEIEHMLMQLNGYLIVSKYLRTISHNNYTRGVSYHDSEIENFLKKINKYKFSYNGNGEIYNLAYKGGA
ncbi:hypothetical protein [Sulfurospirillum sp. hDNRA2]|uniref:hypothetical protein n=1 Tax=Sulfurospirillum sp. hDNRA2 TaxID=3237298 RepID=UPI0020B7FD6A|nr:hypothetical protein [Sulfurospirillum sp. DNRA8]MCP3651615.1 hypothetical protein [Sulfurospirillum sp. DNRA8]MCR1810462.1 hypothetical protein [Sulfurospirillum sp. DNRA8]